MLNLRGTLAFCFAECVKGVEIKPLENGEAKELGLALKLDLASIFPLEEGVTCV